jgi:hypothetical protein
MRVVGAMVHRSVNAASSTIDEANNSCFIVPDSSGGRSALFLFGGRARSAFGGKAAHE